MDRSASVINQAVHALTINGRSLRHDLRGLGPEAVPLRESIRNQLLRTRKEVTQLVLENPDANAEEIAAYVRSRRASHKFLRSALTAARKSE